MSLDDETLAYFEVLSFYYYYYRRTLILNVMIRLLMIYYKLVFETMYGINKRQYGQTLTRSSREINNGQVQKPK